MIPISITRFDITDDMSLNEIIRELYHKTSLDYYPNQFFFVRSIPEEENKVEVTCIGSYNA